MLIIPGSLYQHVPRINMKLILFKSQPLKLFDSLGVEPNKISMLTKIEPHQNLLYKKYHFLFKNQNCNNDIIEKDFGMLFKRVVI